MNYRNCYLQQNQRIARKRRRRRKSPTIRRTIAKVAGRTLYTALHVQLLHISHKRAFERRIKANVFFSIIAVLLQMCVRERERVFMCSFYSNINGKMRERMEMNQRRFYKFLFFLSPCTHWISASNWSRTRRRDVQQTWKNGWKATTNKKKTQRKLTAVVQWKCIISRKVIMFIRRSGKENGKSNERKTETGENIIHCSRYARTEHASQVVK